MLSRPCHPRLRPQVPRPRPQVSRPLPRAYIPRRRPSAKTKVGLAPSSWVFDERLRELRLMICFERTGVRTLWQNEAQSKQVATVNFYNYQCMYHWLPRSRSRRAKAIDLRVNSIDESTLCRFDSLKNCRSTRSNSIILLG